jgi:putative flippase GtrA
MPALSTSPSSSSWHVRPWLGRAALLFGKNSLAGAVAFAFDMALLWLLVERAHWTYLPAAALAFLVAVTLHYALARRFVFAGSEQSVARGYLYFVANAAVGLAVTLAAFALLVELFELNYLVARLISSVKAGVVVFVLNAVFNFRVL